MDPQTAMETVTEGAKAVTKFEEIVQKVFGPKWTRKQADADKYADEQKLQTIRNNPDMEIVYVAGEMHARERTKEELAIRAEQRRLLNEIKQEENIENILEITANEIQQIEDVPTENVDEDWIARFFEYAPNVNSNEMQLIWAKLLAGEIAKPNSFSLRTLDTVRNLSKKEAETFQEIVPFIMEFDGEGFISSEKSILEKHNISFEKLLLLKECGLVNMSLSFNPMLSSNDKAIIFSDKILIRLSGNEKEKKKVSFGIHLLTKPGKELYNILSHDSNEVYAYDLAESVFNSNKDKAVLTLHKVNSITKDNINCDVLPLKTLNKKETSNEG